MDGIAICLNNFKIDLNEFESLVKRIKKENTFKSYPDINDIPN